MIPAWLFVLVVWLLLPGTAHAYIGPGAGFAVVSTLFVLAYTMLLSLLALVTWPIRWVLLRIRRMRTDRRSRVRRVVVLGLDGQDPELTEAYLQQGRLPHFQQLKEQGCFLPLETTLPAESPVAWSSFLTGCNPGKHRIYDFLVPNRKRYWPELSSAHVERSNRILKLGPYRMALGRPRLTGGRKSQPFWKLLGRHGVRSTILRVPITFPPEKFQGLLLSAMCVPDLLGGQGTYFYYSTDGTGGRALTSGIHIPVQVRDGCVHTHVPGPPNAMRPDAGDLNIPLHIRVHPDGNGIDLDMGKQTCSLERGRYTPWVRLVYRPGLGTKIHGLARFYLIETSPALRLYLSPIHIDPERPALPLSHPVPFSMYLAKTQGPFATLGVAEDTSALNEGILGEAPFLEQCYDIHRERETMFFDALRKRRHGLVTCVFDLTDRVQHMFFRHLDPDHPAHTETGAKDFAEVIPNLYRDMDTLVGKTLRLLKDDDLLFVISDHGFKSFRYEVDLNAWLHQNGFLAVHQERSGNDLFHDVDWQGTRAFAMGFGGIYLNLEGREGKGIVSEGEEANRIRTEIAAGLSALVDERSGVHPVVRVYDAREAYQGPYVGEAPDLVVGFTPGYRAAWNTVTGGVGNEVISNNMRPWSGDHNFNPPDVPGILFCNRPITAGRARITDIAATVLDLYGVRIPDYMDGESLMPAGEEGR